MIFIFIVGVTYLASMALMTPYLQTLMGYPVVTAGIVMGPRGMGTMVCMFLVGQADRQGRHPLAAADRARPHRLGHVRHDGLDARRLADGRSSSTGFVQGAGLGFLFVPLTTVTFSTLPAATARRGHRPLQPVAQHRLQRRHLGRVRAADREHAGQPRRDRRLCDALQPALRQSPPRPACSTRSRPPAAPRSTA